MRFIIHLADGRAYPVEHVVSADLTPEASTLRFWCPIQQRRTLLVDGSLFNAEGLPWDRTIVRVEVT